MVAESLYAYFEEHRLLINIAALVVSSTIWLKVFGMPSRSEINEMFIFGTGSYDEVLKKFPKDVLAYQVILVNINECKEIVCDSDSSQNRNIDEKKASFQLVEKGPNDLPILIDKRVVSHLQRVFATNIENNETDYEFVLLALNRDGEG